MAVAPLLAPGGVEMRVVSQVASFTWGSWHVDWPEGYEPPDPPAEDRELGWIADLGGTEVEPFGRCWVRADAQIDATLGRSNVEDVLDAAKYRTSGEVFLETEIPFENLAGQLPYRDFNVNSFVPVRVGGRILENQLVTKVAESEDEQGRRTATVYLGGQKFQDREALRTANREIDRVIAQERREREDVVGAQFAAAQEYAREQVRLERVETDRKRKEALESSERAVKDFVLNEDKKVVSQAETIAGETLESAKRWAKSNAETVATNKASETLEKAQQALKNYSLEVDAKIGAQGELTRGLKELNDDYKSQQVKVSGLVQEQGALSSKLTSLSNDFSAKLGPNSSVMKAVNGQAEDAAVLDAMVKGTYHRKLSGSQFQEHQNTVNRVQSSFNKRQTSINSGFADLFKAQDQINAVNSAFQSKQHDINSGFAALFEAQAYTNDLQLAFNKEQVGINRTYDQMWLTQAILDLTQNYAIDYNRIVADAYAPKQFEITILSRASGRLVTGDRKIFSGSTFVNQTTISNPSGSEQSFYDVKVHLQPGLLGIGNALLSDSTSGISMSQFSPGVVVADSLNSQIWFSFGTGNTTQGKRIVGAFVPSSLSSGYRADLDKLTSSFESEKKKLRDEYKRRWG